MIQPGHHKKSDGEVTISKSDSWSIACRPLDGPVVLLDEVVEVFVLAHQGTSPRLDFGGALFVSFACCCAP